MNAYGDTLAALADPTRRAILELLRDGPLTVGELADEMPVSRPAVSQHLAVLRNAQLVSEERMGTRRLYSANAEGLAALRTYLEDVWGKVLADFTAEAKKRRKRTR